MSSDAASPTVVEERETSIEITGKAKGQLLVGSPSWDGSQTLTSTFHTSQFMPNCVTSALNYADMGISPKKHQSAD